MNPVKKDYFYQNQDVHNISGLTEVPSKAKKGKVLEFFTTVKDKFTDIFVNRKGPLGKVVKYGLEKTAIASSLITGIMAVKTAVAPFFSNFNAASAATSDFSKHITAITEKAAGLQYLSALLAPLSFVTIIKGIMSIATGTPDQKVEGGLAIAQGAGELGGHAATIGQGVTNLGWVAQTGISWANIVGCAGAIVSAIAIAVHSWSLHKTNEFLEKSGLKNYLEKSGQSESIEQAFNKATDNLIAMDENLLKKNFKVGPTKLKQKIQQIKNIANEKIQSGKPEEVATGKKLMKATLSNLKGRILDKIFSHKLGILISVVSIVALGILMFTPLAPLAYTIMAIGAAVAVGSLIYEYVRKRQFKKAMGIVGPVAGVEKSKVEEQKEKAKVSMPRRESKALIEGSNYHQALLDMRKRTRAASERIQTTSLNLIV